MIEVTNLVKKYGNHTAVDHLNFTLEGGKVYGLLGPNGAGKSTTMNIMTGYIGPSEGTVVINGHDILKEPEEAKKCIGYLPEIPPLYVDMTVEEYLKFAAELKEVPAKGIKEEVDRAEKMTGLEEVKQRLIKNLSKGYRQRVGLAQAILGRPEVIILDEPTVGLDPKQIIEIRSLIKELSKEHTVILSSHILSEISAVSDYILIISHGKLVAYDTTDNLLHNMGNDSILTLTLKAEAEAAHKGIASIDENLIIKDIAENDGLISMEVRNEKKDIREEVFKLCCEQNWPIYEMKYSNATLEDVFMELTADEKEHKEEQK